MNSLRFPRISKCTASLLLMLCFIFRVNAAPGDLDSSFGGTGLVRTGFGGGFAEVKATALQSDGKIVLAGTGTGDDSITRITLIRLNTNNLIDPTFGKEGRVVLDITNQFAAPYSDVAAMRLQPDGKIVLSGVAYHGTNVYSVGVVVRLNSDGSLDSSFGKDGKAFNDVGGNGNGRFTTLSLQGDGKIIAAGWIYPPTSYQHFMIARYKTNGVLDASFGTNGVEVMDGLYGGATASIIESDGKAIVVGRGGSDDFVVTRSTTNGVLDSTFGGGDGYTITRFPNIPSYTPDATPTAVSIVSSELIVSPDKILLSGYAARGTSSNVVAMARYNMDGSTDTTFGSNGIATAEITSDTTGAYAQTMVLQNSGKTKKIIIAGSCSYPGKMFIARFTAGGTFDTTFGNGTGKETLTLPGPAGCNAMLIQGGGYLLVGLMTLSDKNSLFTAMRVTSDGTPDSTFGTNGLVTADVADRTAAAYSVAVQTDGKTVAVGSTSDGNNPHFAVVRYNLDGTLDQSFGNGGKVVTKLFTNDNAYCVAIQPDGKILAAGTTYFPPNNYFVVVRYNANGSLDSSFGVNGRTNFFAGGDCRTLKIQSDGKILLGGSATPSGYPAFAMARLTASGALDPSFGGGVGITTAFLPTPSYSMANSILPTPTGIYLCGLVEFVSGGSSVDENFALAHYNTNGAVDFSFGNSGRLTTDFNNGTLDASMASVMQSDGKFIMAGSSSIMPNSYLALARYNPNGSLDNSFGASGLVVSQVGFASDTINALALQNNGKIVAAGNTSMGGLNKFFAIRYNANGSFDDFFGEDGVAYVDFGTGTNESCNAMALDKFGRTILAGDGGGLFGIVRITGESSLVISSISQMPNGHMLLTGIGNPSAPHTLQASATANGTFTSLDTVTTDASGNWQYEDSATAGVTARFYRLSYP